MVSLSKVEQASRKFETDKEIASQAGFQAVGARRVVANASDSFAWVLAQAALTVTTRYGESNLKLFCKSFDVPVPYGTAKRYRSAYQAYADEDGNVKPIEGLNFKHYQVLAGIEPETRAQWLQRAKAEGLSASALQKLLHPTAGWKFNFEQSDVENLNLSNGLDRLAAVARQEVRKKSCTWAEVKAIIAERSARKPRGK